MKRTVIGLAFAAWLFVPHVVLAQSSTGGPGEAQALAREAALRQAIAEQLIADREAASGRPFDPSARQTLKNNLGAKSSSELQAMQLAGVGPKVAGDTSQDLVFVPITPCRILDTRFGAADFGTFGGGGQQRSYRVTDPIPAAQGGGNGSCGVPFGGGGAATAIVINVTATGFFGVGDVRITPFGTAMPLASVLNYNPDQGFAIANGIVVQICDPATAACGSDFTVQVDGAGTDFVADVMGYFRAFNEISSQAVFFLSPVPNTALSPATAAQLGSITFTPRGTARGPTLASVTTTVRVQARGHCNITDAGSQTNVVIYLGPIAPGPTLWIFESGVIRPTFAPGVLHQLGWTAERYFSVLRGAATTIKLLGYHEVVGTDSSTECTGTIVVNGLF